MATNESSQNDAHPTPQNNLLLSSLAEFWSLIEPLLNAVQPGTVCEIGIGGGKFTRQLLDFCAKNSCRFTGIDALVGKEVFAGAPLERTQFFKASSLEVLTSLDAQDVYFVDGDHNYYTVLNELRQILRHADRWPLIFLHDIGWPWARRDHYCAPDSIPQEFRHDFSTTLGVMPERSELGEGGFSGDNSDYSYGAADHEGGARNGVLTAVEDFLREPGGTGWNLITLPGVFGLGILYAPNHCAAGLKEPLGVLGKAAATFSPLLQAVEKNRLDLFLAHLNHLARWKNFKGDYEKLDSSYTDLDKHSASLLKEYQLLLEKYDELFSHYQILAAKHNSLVQDHETLKKTTEAQRVAPGIPSPPPPQSQ